MTGSIFRLLILSITLALAACPALAQQINGRVFYADGNRPAFNVPVECSGTNCSGYQYTDRQGKFTWTLGGSGAGGVTGAGQYTITVRVPGYLIETRSVTLLDNTSNEYMHFTLKPDPKFAGTAASSPPIEVDAKVPAGARKEFEAGHQAVVGEGKPEKGIPHLEKAISLYPDFLEAYIMLGVAHTDVKQWDKAEKALRRALEIYPKSTEAYFALGELYRTQKKYKEAEQAIREGIKINDKSWRGHLALGRLYWDMGEIAKAGPEVGQALKIKPDLAEGHLLAGNILMKARQAENALVEFEEYLRLEPNGKYAPQTREFVAKIKKALAERKK